MVSSQTDLLIQTVNNEANRLGGFLTGLDEQMWSRDSACEGWVIGDVVAHLAGGAATWANAITRAVSGDSGPPEGQDFMAPASAALRPSGKPPGIPINRLEWGLWRTSGQDTQAWHRC